MSTLVEKAALCGILARAFGPSEKKAVESSNELKKIGKAFTGMLIGEIKPADENAISMEMVRLFDRAECPPYETSYRSDKDAQKDVVLSDIAGFYRAFGIAPKNEYPDHIVAELEFLGILFLKEAHCRANYDSANASIAMDARKKFIKEHLSWVPKFSKALEEKSRIGFYVAMGNVLEDFVKAESNGK